jgi:predicted CoA-binding protein
MMRGAAKTRRVGVSEADELLKGVQSIVVVDWPSRDVPDSLALAGYSVVVCGGPGRYSAYERREGEVLVREVAGPPEHADLVYAHRPLAELPEVVALAKSVGARAVWSQSGLVSDGVRDARGCWEAPNASLEARKLVEAAGMVYIHDDYIGDVARRVRRERR